METPGRSLRQLLHPGALTLGGYPQHRVRGTPSRWPGLTTGKRRGGDLVPTMEPTSIAKPQRAGTYGGLFADPLPNFKVAWIASMVARG